MKYVKLFEHFVNEFADTNRAYPYHFEGAVYQDEDNPEEGAEGIAFSFETATERRIKYNVSLELRRFNYDFSFVPEHGGFNTMTAENDALRVIATVAKILIDIVENYYIQPVPIVVKGSIVKGKEASGLENKRDRIYKHIAQREIHGVKPKDPNVRGYEFVDLGRLGFQLNPIYA
jgi:hypothetical protein